MNHFLPLIALCIVTIGVCSCKRAKVAQIVDDELNQDICSLTGGEVDSFQTKKGTSVDIFSVKHGSLIIRIGGKYIYVDPVGKGAQPATDYSAFPEADYILVTHDHGDHLDTDAVSQLEKEGTKVLCNEGSVGKLSGIIAETDVIQLHNGDGITTDEGWNIDAVPAYNISQEKLNFHPQGHGNGYVISIEGLRIYVAGDTEDIPEMADLKDVDVAFLPCNLPYTMTPEQCAAAARMFSPKVLFPYHYGETEIQTLVTLLSDTGIDVRIRSYK